MKQKFAVGFFLTIATGLVILLWPHSNNVFAEIFKWKDERGKTHYTNSLSKVPKKYRTKGLEARTEKGEKFTVLVNSLLANGKTNRKFKSFDDAILKYMKERGIGAGTLAIRNKNKLVYQQAYGWSDEKNRISLRPNALFRIASLTKPVTAGAIYELIRQGKISLKTKVIPYLHLKPASGGKVDPRSGQITVKNLIHHESGWDKDVYDISWDVFNLAKKFGYQKVPGFKTIAQHALDEPLHFNPGSKYAYNNLNYLILGMVIEKASKMDYFSFLQKYAFKANGVSNFYLARTLKKHQQPREVFYRDPRHRERSELNLSSRKKVPRPYGGFMAERLMAFGGLVASAPEYTKFMENYSVFGNKPKRGGEWFHRGRLAGTFTIAIWESDGMKIVAFFNQSKDSSGLDYRVIYKVLKQAAQKYHKTK
jgi:CubicO group peptidase (beta-lactamase class C family)